MDETGHRFEQGKREKMITLGCRTRQFLRIGNFTLVGLANLRSQQRDHGNRLAIQGSKFYLVAFALLMNQHHGSNVTALKPMLGKGGLQNDVFSFINHGVLRFKG